MLATNLDMACLAAPDHVLRLTPGMNDYGMNTSNCGGGATLGAVVLTVTGRVAKQIQELGSWIDGPLPVMFVDEAGVEHPADLERRTTFFGPEVRTVLYGQDALAAPRWSRRWHRFTTAEDRAGDGVSVLGLELLRVSLGGGALGDVDISEDLLIVHVGVAGSADEAASTDDVDLKALARLIHPERWLGAESPAGLADLLGLSEADLVTCLDTQQPWWTLVRSVTSPHTFEFILRGASSGAASKLSAEDLAKDLVSTSTVIGPVWTAEAHPRGLGFARRLTERAGDARFFDTSAPAYARSIYLDVVILARMQHDLLGHLRRELATTPLPRSGSLADTRRVVSLQRSVANYRIRVWWSSMGRGSLPDVWLRRLQSAYDLRARLEDLEAESSSVRDVLAAVGSVEASEARLRSGRTAQNFSSS